MPVIPKNIYSVESVREMDRIAIEEQGIPGYELMQRAADAALRAARDHFPMAKRWQLLCGGGNNGGDGYVLARLARENGINSSVLAMVDPATLVDDARLAYTDFMAAGGQWSRWNDQLDGDAELLVDAILGSGLQRDLSGVFSKAVDAINSHAAPVLALDIASGLDGNTGRILGAAVNAQLTTTFVGLKSGLFLADGPGCSGHLMFDDLGIGPDAVSRQKPVYRQMDDTTLSHALPPRPRNAHKGDFGHVLVVGGALGMPGAVRLCAEAALRTGAGRVSVATHPEHAALISSARPELMSHGVSTGNDLKRLLESADVVAFGPGLGQSDWARSLYDVLATDTRAAVWDADALNYLARSPDRANHRIITPHPGEAARLLGITSAQVQLDRTVAAASLFDKYAGTAVLKGAGTLVSDASGPPFVSRRGNPGMAAPGMGDALTGIIAALLAQGLVQTNAAAIGVELHARAGDSAASAGERGLITTDLIRALPSVVNP